MSFFEYITISDFITIVLTCIIAYSVWWQSKSTQKLVDLTVQSEKRSREKENPVLHIEPRIDIGFDAEGRQKKYRGYVVTNASHFDITIVHFSLSLGVPVDGDPPPFRHPQHTNYHNLQQIADWSVPRRLQHSESMKIMFDVEKVMELFRSEEEEDRTVRFQPRFRDSLGNVHTSSWTSWSTEFADFHDDPGLGFITLDEWFSRY